MDITRVLSCVGYILLAPFLGGLLDGMDRKISARMQGRRGPSVFQPFYDIVKLFNKQIFLVNRSQFFMVVSYLVFVIFSGALIFAGYDLLMGFFALTTAAMFLVLAACSTHSPFGALASQRELLQMMAYEPMVLLTCVGFYLATGSFQVAEITQNTWSPIVYLPGFFLGFSFILTLKMRKPPFDLYPGPPAHQEMVRGVTTEMVGSLYAVTEIAEWYENVMLLGILALFFINQNPLSWPLAILAVLAVYFLEILVDNTAARLKWDKVFSSSWLVTLLCGGLNLLVLDLVIHLL